MLKGVAEVGAVFAALNAQKRWVQLEERYKAGRGHTYRDGSANHNGHSNDRPSYFALGFATLEEMAAAVDAKEMGEHERCHYNCCGIPQAKGPCLRRKERLALLPSDAANAPTGIQKK